MKGEFFSRFIRRVCHVGGKCKNFGHEGSGVQCEMQYDWRKNVVYTLELRSSGINEWEGSIHDASSNARKVIARIKVPSGYGNLKSSTLSFVEEYSQGAEQLTSCNAVSSSAAAFYSDTMEGIAASQITSNTYGNCGHKARATKMANNVCIGTVVGRQGAPTSPILVDGSGGKAGPSLVNSKSGKCVAVQNDSAANSANIQQYSCNDTAAQAWEKVPAKGCFLLRNGKSYKCLDVQKASKADGANVLLYDCHGGANQTLNWHGSSLKFNHSGKCLDVSGGSTADGGNILQWSCHGSNNQHFTHKGDTDR